MATMKKVSFYSAACTARSLQAKLQRLLKNNPNAESLKILKKLSTVCADAITVLEHKVR